MPVEQVSLARAICRTLAFKSLLNSDAGRVIGDIIHNSNMTNQLSTEDDDIKAFRTGWIEREFMASWMGRDWYLWTELVDDHSSQIGRAEGGSRV